MKRPIFIIIGTVIVFILLGIWVYVLFFSSPNNDQSFTDLNFTGTTTTTYNPVVEETEPTVNVTEPKALRQLTTKPTAGYQEVMRSASSSPELWYIESGTGHIFLIDLNSGVETRLSATTIPLTTTGAITPNGQFVMIQSGTGANTEFNIGTFSSTSTQLTVTPIDEHIISFKATTDNTFLYAVKTNDAVIAKHYDPTNNTTQTIFTLPFREAIIEWGDSVESTHYAYPKAASRLEGFLYQITDGVINRLPIDGYGLSATGNEVSVIFSRQDNNTYQTHLYNHDVKTSYYSTITAIPEKCTNTSESSSLFICGADLITTYDSLMPDQWYQGTKSFTDDLWEIDTTSGVAELISSLSDESGRNLDVVNLNINSNQTHIYFINKTDQTVWLYDRTVNNQSVN